MIATKTKLLVIFLLLISQILLVSCSDKKDALNINIDGNNINQQIQAQLFPTQNTFETVKPVFLLVQSFSTNKIVFSNNFNVRIFKQTKNQWVEVKEKPIDRLPKDDIVFSPVTETRKIFAVFPELTDYTHNVQLRIYVIGNMETDQGTQKVAAYVDVELHP